MMIEVGKKYIDAQSYIVTIVSKYPFKGRDQYER